MQLPVSVLCAAYSRAAQEKGRPLSDEEKSAIHKATLREAYRVRFTNVIRLAGYSEYAQHKICEEYIDRYMTNLEAFDKMLTEYEQSRGDPM